MTYIAIIVLTALCGAWAFRRVLVADRARWARREETRRLYQTVSGKVLVRNIGGFDIYTPNEGIIPEGTVLFVPADVFHGHSFLLEPIYPSEPDTWRMRASWEFTPVIRPESMFKITGVT